MDRLSLSVLFAFLVQSEAANVVKDKVNERVVEPAHSYVDQAVQLGVGLVESAIQKTLYELAFFAVIFMVLLILLVYVCKSPAKSSATAPNTKRKTRTNKVD